ncbi:ribosome assembly RNA-binding protein YhbY [Gilliamella apicola]|uniref:ribosome assembly RNA-binding protein YhbY n=1 Tax=Gilliamella apicola TaxID=1196095 RepID=UPI002FEE0DAC
MNLSNKQKQYLKSEAHHLKPIVMIGANGFTEGVLAEIENALNFHELIKIKISVEDRETKKLICEAIIRETDALAVQQVGSIFTIFRPSEEKKIALPK